MPPKPTVTVLMSVYNGEKYLREAMDSILAQTFTDFEFIIIDDGSTDSVWEILNGYNDPRIRLVSNDKNIGLTKSLNKGLALAGGKYIARQDADDISLPERLASQVSYLERHRNTGLLGTAYYVMNFQGQRIATHRQPPTDTQIRWQMLFHSAFCHTSVMFRRNLFGKGEPFYNEALAYGQDYSLWARLLKQTRAANLQEPQVVFRVHENSIQATHREEQQHIASTISAQQINMLMPDRPLSRSTIDTLRHWYYHFPRRLTTQEIVPCQALLQILDAFEKQPNIDPDIARDLRQHWIDRILTSMPLNQPSVWWTTGFLGMLLPSNALLVLVQPPKRVARAIRRMGKALTSL